MTEAAMPPADDVAGNQPDQAQVEERVDLDPHEQPNAPNRAPQTESVGPGPNDASSVRTAVSDDDELDRPDNAVRP
jgi:hypothetical protein